MSSSPIDDFSNITAEWNFNRLDKAVARGLTTYIDVGQALAEIENLNLLREQLPTFEPLLEHILHSAPQGPF